ncbi:MAG: MFS transporter [Elusimicrobia bacterium]|nr:MFS transporter [Elusimicrobiota bacterium]
MISKAESRNPWHFVPTIYFAEGLPYVIVNSVSVILYKNMGVSNARIAFWTSWLYLPWVIKMLWGPMVDMYGTRRKWTVYTQAIMAFCLAAAAMSLGTPHFFTISLAAFAVAAFVSATHDIAVDGFYMLALTKEDQAFFVGIRSMFYRFAMIFGTGFLVYRAGQLQEAFCSVPDSWAIMLLAPALIFLILFIYHRFILPYPSEDIPKAKAEPLTILRSIGTLAAYLLAAGALVWLFNSLSGLWQKLGLAAALTVALVIICRKFIFPYLRRKMAAEGSSFNEAFISYFTQDSIGYIIAFILFYRFAEAMLLKLTSPFLLDASVNGGLGISTSEVGIMYGTAGMIALITGGLLGGWLISRYGFRKCLWPMVFALHVPDVFYLYMSYAQPAKWIAYVLVSAEQFGYGVGLTAFTVYLMMICRGKYKTAHFAISTGIMALGMMVPGMISGKIQESLGYRHFFLTVCLLTIPGILVILKLPIKEDEIMPA